MSAISLATLVASANLSTSMLAQIPVVSEFADVLSDVVSGLSLVREVEFAIDLVPSTTLIFRAPYRITPLEFRELKTQLQELLEDGFIRPSVLPWGTLVSSLGRRTTT